jgi:hypothetical protein
MGQKELSDFLLPADALLAFAEESFETPSAEVVVTLAERATFLVSTATPGSFADLIFSAVFSSRHVRSMRVRKRSK